jgi:hypothetical protein
MRDLLQFANRNDSPGFLARTILIFLLLLAVAGLSTAAKRGQYYPGSSPDRHVSISTKMNVSHAPVVVAGDQQRPDVRLAPPPPVIPATRFEHSEAPSVERIGVTVSMQHRSPPYFLA